MDTLDQFVSDLQAEINEEMRKTYGDIVFKRWQNPLYMGRMTLTDGYARHTGSCGDTMEIFLRFEDGKVKEASFLTDGCASSMVCGSFAAELAIGKTPEEIKEITGEIILDILGGLPDHDRHCAFLAAETLHLSVANYLKASGRKTG